MIDFFKRNCFSAKDFKIITFKIYFRYQISYFSKIRLIASHNENFNTPLKFGILLIFLLVFVGFLIVCFPI